MVPVEVSLVTCEMCLLTYLLTYILQGQQQCALGFILPTSVVLKKQLIALQVTSVEPLPTNLLVQNALKTILVSTFSGKTILAVWKPPKIQTCVDYKDGARRATCTQIQIQII